MSLGANYLVIREPEPLLRLLLSALPGPFLMQLRSRPKKPDRSESRVDVS